MQLIIDIGNTNSKFAVFQERSVVEHGRIDGDLRAGVKGLLERGQYESVAMASVSIPEEELRKMIGRPNVLILTGNTPTPLTSRYTTMHSLGTDRIANTIAAYQTAEGRSALAIDVGTCITYDLVDANGEYQGGTIAPGLHLRARAMNAYSARLPLVDPDPDAPLIGTDTQGSMLSGVMHGAMQEMRGMIERYEEQRPGLLVFLTGGDAPYFTGGLKSGIFADPLLTLKGIHAILQHQT